MALCSRSGAGLAGVSSIGSLLVALAASAMHAQAPADCRGGTAENCLALGDKYRDGVDVAKDPARAAALYQTACDAGVLAACNRLGALYERQDAARAVALYKKACEGGDSYGCVNLGRAYWAGVGVGANANQAVVFFQIACDGGGLPGCTRSEEHTAELQ